MPEDVNTAINASAAPAAKALKRVAASRGKLQGNFYFASDGKASVAAIAISLTAKDKKGMKVAAEGKKLRKTLKATKFARGTVISTGAKLRFVVHSGSATPGLMKKAFKKAFDDSIGDDVKALKRYLRKAVIGTPDGEDEAVADSGEQDGDTTLSRDDVTLGRDDEVLTLEERLELDALLREQGSLSRQNQELASSFLSAEEEEADHTERLQEMSRQLGRLMRAPDKNADAIQALWAQLAEEQFTGEELLSQRSPTVSKPTLQLILSADSTMRSRLALSKAVAAYQTARAAAEKQLEALKGALKKTGDADLVAIADRGVAAMLALGLDRLQGALDKAGDADRDGLAAALEAVVPALGAALSTVNTHPAFAAVDDNPFGVAVSVRKTLTPPLIQLQNACAS